MIKDKPKVLIVGGDSFIGRALSDALIREGVTVWKTSRCNDALSEQTLYLNLSNDIMTWNSTNDIFTAVVFCAAVTSLRKCAAEPEATRIINVLNTFELARRFSETGALVVFLSTSLVFDGKKPFPKINDPINPQSEYGRQKAEAEQKIMFHCKRYCIVRLGKVISAETPLFLQWITNLKAGKVIHPFSDMGFSPISINYTVNLLVKIIKNQKMGIIHATGPEDITYAQAAQFIAERLALDTALISPVECKSQPGYSHIPRHTALGELMEGEARGKIGYEALSAISKWNDFSC